MGEAEDLRLVRLRQLAQLAARRPETERRSLVDGQLVAREVLRPERGRRLEVAPPTLQRRLAVRSCCPLPLPILAGAIDQVERHGGEARSEGKLDRLARLAGSVAAAEEAERAGVERLNAQGEHRHSQLAPAAGALGGDVLGVGLE